MFKLRSNYSYTFNKIKYSLIFQCLSSFIISKLINQWFLASEFEIFENSNLNFILSNIGYILSILFIVWIVDWEKTVNKSLSTKTHSQKLKKSSTKKYSFQLINYAFFILTIFTLLILITYQLINGCENIVTCLMISISNLLFIVQTFYFYLLGMFILLFLNNFIKIIQISSFTMIIYILGKTWALIALTYQDSISFNANNKNIEEILGVILIISLFLLFQLILTLWKNHISLKNLSEVSNNALTKDQLIKLISIYKMDLLLLFFFIGISN